MYNPAFKPLEFEGFKKQAGLNSFVMTPKKWIESTNAIGITPPAQCRPARSVRVLLRR